MAVAFLHSKADLTTKADLRMKYQMSALHQEERQYAHIYNIERRLLVIFDLAYLETSLQACFLSCACERGLTRKQLEATRA